MARTRKAAGSARKAVKATPDIEFVAAQAPESSVTDKPDAPPSAMQPEVEKASPTRERQEQPAADVNPFPRNVRTVTSPGGYAVRLNQDQRANEIQIRMALP